MTLEEALNFVDAVVAGTNGTRADHIKGQEAINVIRAACTKDENDDGAGV